MIYFLHVTYYFLPQATLNKQNIEEFLSKRLQDKRNNNAHLQNLNDSTNLHNSCIGEDDQLQTFKEEIRNKEAHITKIGNELISCQNENSSLHEKLRLLERDKVEIESTLRKTEEDLERMETLNKSWQTSSLNNWENIEEKIMSKFENLENRPRFSCFSSTERFPVGYVSEDGIQIHLGRNEWLPVTTYAFAVSNARTTSVLTRNLATAVFTDKVLIKCTLTGKHSNRTKMNNTDDISTISMDKLDPVKVMAIKDIVRHYLIEELHKTEIEADVEVDLVRNYICKKIADLKDEKKGNKAHKRKTKVAEQLDQTANRVTGVSSVEDSSTETSADYSNTLDESESVSIIQIDPFENNVSFDSVMHE